MSKSVKIIFHIDLNAFYASCAMIKEPFLKEQVFVIGGRLGSTSGVVSTASYKARALGIHSGMSVQDSLRIYPKLLVVPTDFSLYQKYSNIFFRFLKSYTNIILKGSIDEAYLDVTEIAKDKHPLKLAEEIQTELYQQFKLPVSIGIGPTLFLAKMASDMKKPLGITVLRKRDMEKVLFPMSVGKVYGIGRKTHSLLNDIGIKTIADFYNPENKNRILEVMTIQSYEGFIDNIGGNSSNVVNPDLYATPKSISNEETLNYSVNAPEVLIDHLKDLTRVSVDRMINEEMVTRTISIKLKYDNFKTITRSKSIEHPTADFNEIFQIAEDLFYSNYNSNPVRLVGIGLSQLILKKDLKDEITLFNYHEATEKEEKISQVISKINDSFNEKVIVKGINKK